MRPDDIPQDVWAAAAVGADHYSKRQVHIARAILAERERCAKVAEKHASPGQMWERDEMPTAKLAVGYAARDIAAAIRKGGD